MVDMLLQGTGHEVMISIVKVDVVPSWWHHSSARPLSFFLQLACVEEAGGTPVTKMIIHPSCGSCRHNF